MHFDAVLLASLTDDELEDTLNWCRTRQKDYRRRGAYGLSCFWSDMSAAIVAEMGALHRTPVTVHDEQLTLDVPGRVSFDERVWRGLV